MANPLIITASRKTDIPAFYGQWFLNRLRQGWAVNFNHYNRKASRVALDPGQVLAFVFVSKNFAPFLSCLDQIQLLGYEAFFQYTITGLPRVFEPVVPPVEASLDVFHTLSDRFSPARISWRYDPILLTSVTSPEYHLKSFRALCAGLEGRTSRCYTSFAHIYRKVERRLPRLAAHGITLLEGFGAEARRHLAEEMADIAQSHGIQLFSCCNDFLAGGKIRKGRCVDAELIARLTGRSAAGYRPRPTREECGCFASVDIGMYDTCPHACLYCYANTGQDRVRRNYSRFDAAVPALVAGVEPPPQEEQAEQLTFPWGQSRIPPSRD